MPPELVIGWDIGGAHVKACLLEHGRLRDIVQWPCPLWLGLDRLDTVLVEAAARWPALSRAAHAATMTGEMADLFPDRETGVQAIAARLEAACGTPVRWHAGPGDTVATTELATRWPQVASANWSATAAHAAAALPCGVLVDIGSTTTDVIAFADGQIRSPSMGDADRLATGELIYQGMVRTPLAVLGPRIPFQGRPTGLMNELFATAADIYRLTGELDPAHDQQPAADGGAKTVEASRRRLARMVGRDAHEAPDADWLALAQAFRARQFALWDEALLSVIDAAGLPIDTPLVAAGCGAALVQALATARGARCLDYDRDVVRAPDALAGWAAVCAPAVAVASLAAGAASAPVSGSGRSAAIDGRPAPPSAKEVTRCGS